MIIFMQIKEGVGDIVIKMSTGTKIILNVMREWGDVPSWRSHITCLIDKGRYRANQAGWWESFIPVLRT
ncbi:hypothetical protein C0J52_24307 [Blattella germanica]|nr:hypothetical protein C0J52_24307 [Blattella germanica]